MKKAIILVAALIAGMQSAGAADNGGVSGVHYSQYTTPDPVNSDSPFVLTLESYLTASTIRDTAKTAADIVMVLDVSGSMGYNMDTSHQGYYPSGSSYTYKNVTGDTQYYFPYDGVYRQVKGIQSSGGKYYWMYFDAGSTRFYLSGTGGFEAADQSTPTWDGSSGTKPQKKSGGAIEPVNSNKTTIWSKPLFVAGTVSTRLEALVESSVVFIDSMRVYSLKYGIDNRIGMLTFAYEAKTLCNFLSVKDNYISLIGYILSLSTGGATRADYGLQAAKTMIDSYSLTANTKSTILFTDGVPTSQSSFEEDVANSAIDYSRQMKQSDKKVIVYSIGFFKKGQDTNMDKYMQYVSSDYPDAQSLTNPGEAKGSDYEHMTTDASELVQFFQKVGQKIISMGNPISVGKQASLVESFTQYVKIPSGDVADIVKTYTATCNGKSGDELTFASRVAYSGDPLTINIDRTNNTVKVSGFDYAANWCGDHGSSSYSGKKLIVEITNLKLTDDYPGGEQPIADPTKTGFKSNDTLFIAKTPQSEAPAAELHSITVTVTNLKKDETVVYIVKDETTGTIVANLVLTGTSDGSSDSATTKALSTEHNYSVTPAPWSKRTGISASGTTYTTLPEDKTHTVNLNSYAYPSNLSESSVENKFFL